jgi:hypothetical protein
MTRTCLWQRNVRMPRVIVVLVVGAKMWKGREWRSRRARDLRQIEIIGRDYGELLLVGRTVISIVALAWTRVSYEHTAG